MRKLIFLICFLGLVHRVSAQTPKSKFMLTAKAAYAHFLEDFPSSKIYFGSEIGYFLNHQLLLGLNFDYLEYDERPYFEYENPGSGFGDILINPQKWYSLGLFSKLLFDVGRFMPFVKMGFGLYVPRTTSYPDRFLTQGIYYAKDEGYGKTCFGMSFGAGIQYRIWKGFCLQTEGLVTTVQNRNAGSGSDGNLTHANLNAGLSIIF